MKGKNQSSLLTLLIILVVVLLAIQMVLLAGTLKSRSGTATNNTQNNIGYITIRASGTASAQPTIGTLDASAKGMGKTAAAATYNLSLVLSQMNTSLSRYINYNTSLIKTTYYNVYNQTSYCYPVPVAGATSGAATPQAYPYPCYKTYSGFVAMEELAISIPNTQNMSGAIGALSLINGTQVTSAYATLSDQQITALRSTAFAKALENATTQAEILTRNATLSTQNITVNYYNFYPIPYGIVGARAGINGSTVVNPSFYAGTDSVTQSITVVFSYHRQ